jgi:uncharacterized protein
MNKILILSDSHSETDVLVEIKNRHENEVDLIIHCGDSELDARNEAIHDFSIVRGNCDFESRFPDYLVEQCGDNRIFVTHGHLYSVKSTLMNLFYQAKEMKANIVCFGHSHVLGAEMVEDTLFINPGSILLPRKRNEKTYVILEIMDKNAKVRVYEDNGSEIVELSRQFSLHNQ